MVIGDEEAPKARGQFAEGGRRGVQHFLSRDGVERRASDPAAARFPQRRPHVSRPHSKVADRFHVIAPDLPGFGQSDMPDRRTFKYTFDNIARVSDRFTEVVGLGRFAILRRLDGVPTGGMAPRARHRNHLTERKRLCGGAERRVETDPGLLRGSAAGEARCATFLLGARDDRLAIHLRRP
jgi:hypothetical protein